MNKYNMLNENNCNCNERCITLCLHSVVFMGCDHESSNDDIQAKVEKDQTNQKATGQSNSPWRNFEKTLLHGSIL